MINFSHQGMYPTVTIVVVVAMRLSTTDLLSCPGTEANSTMVFKFKPPNPLPQMVEDVESCRDGAITVTTWVSSNITST